MSGIRAHLTYANVMATVAVFLALGGGAYAISVAKNSVGTKQLRKGAVKSIDLRNHGVKSVDIGNGEVRSVDIGDGQVRSVDIGDGQVGIADTASELRLRCTAGTRYFQASCIEETFRGGAAGASWGTARADCVDEDRRLPSAGELENFRNEPGISLAGAEGSGVQAEWTGETSRDGATQRVLVVTDSGALDAGATTLDLHRYRCVASPLG